ncbi:MAG: GNAT family N-acetyltransferase [Chloroflexi bacterium]|nr:GNAT family N-acetyltransferase [Chloroflexota bacterium]
MLHLDVLTTADALHALTPEWHALWSRCTDATPFQSPQWLLPWWTHLGGGELHVITLRAGGDLVGLAPLFAHDWRGRRQITLLGTGISDYPGALFTPEVAACSAKKVLRHMAEVRSTWDMCDWQDLREGSPLLNAPMPLELNAQVEPCAHCPVLLLPSSEDEFMRALSRPRRHKIRRAEKRLRERGALTFHLANHETWRELFDALVRLHEARWREQNGHGMLAEPHVQAFHREALPALLDADMLRLRALRLNGDIIAVLYTIVAHGRAYAYLGGFEYALVECSPGTLLSAHAIGESIRDGLREYDFLRGQEEHKYTWGACDRTNYRVLLTHADSQPARD